MAAIPTPKNLMDDGNFLLRRVWDGAKDLGNMMKADADSVVAIAQARFAGQEPMYYNPNGSMPPYRYPIDPPGSQVLQYRADTSRAMDRPGRKIINVVARTPERAGEPGRKARGYAPVGHRERYGNDAQTVKPRARGQRR